MFLVRVTAAFAAILLSYAVMPAAPAQAAVCESGKVCLYPWADFQGPPVKYTLQGLTADFDSGDETNAFKTIAMSRSMRNRAGSTLSVATTSPKACLRFPCPQYRNLESIPNYQDKAEFVEPHNLIRNATPPRNCIPPVCEPGRVCLYPKPDFQGTPTKYTLQGLAADFGSGDGTKAFKTVPMSESMQNRTGYALHAATKEPKACIRFPCAQYGHLESVAHYQDTAGFIEPHNVIRKAP